MVVKQILGKVTVTPKGEYSSSETYKRLDIVTSNGQSYIAKVDNTGVSVTNTNIWLQLVEKPEKGIDYFTEEDIAQLVSMVTDDSESEFNEYYNGKVSDFDSNASSKTSEFNSNYDEKVESFNTIFDTSTDNFDGNYETKLSAFNENASTQTSTFNSVVEQATSDFNSNASTLTETFNTNASEKTSAFNTNASEKTQEFNDNVDEKTEQITSQLDNYVQFDNYPSNEKAGVVKSHINGFQVSNDGNPNAAILSKEQYDTIENQYFISKGTLENIKDDYVESSTPVKNLNNSLRDLTPKQDIEGTDNTFDDGIESKLYALGGDGKSEQVVTSGKNKLQLTTFDDGTKQKTINNVTATINNDGTISLNGTASAETQFYLTKNDFSLESGNGYFWCNSPSVNCRFEFVASINGEEKYLNSYSTTPNTFNITSSFVYSGSTIIVASGTSTNVTLTPMVSNGTFTEYEPYTGGQPSPSPDYEQPINSIEGSLEYVGTSKNLFNKNTITKQSYLLPDGSLLTGVNLEYNTSDFIPIIPNTQFYKTLTLSPRTKFYDKEKNALNTTTYQDVEIGGNAGSFLTPKDAYYFRFTFNTKPSTGVNIDDVMIVKGTQATEYEPYIEPNQVTFNLNDEKLRSVGDVKDELVVNLDTGDYYKVENVVEEIFDGSDDENWGLDGIEEIYTQFIYYNLLTNPIKRTVVKNNYFSDNNDNRIVLSDKSAYIRFPKSSNFDVSDVDKFKLWLQEHNVIGQYSTQKPTTKKLGTLSSEDLAKLKTFKGYNNVTVNTNLGLMNIRFTYGLDIKKYVDNKIAELSAQMIKGE